MRVDWTTGFRALTSADSTRVAANPATGTPLIAFTKYAAPNPTGGNSGDLFLIAEADGLVHSAVFLEQSSCRKCRPPVDFSMADGIFSLDLQVADACAGGTSFDTHSFVEKVGDPIGRPAVENQASSSGAFRSHVSSRWIIERRVNQGYTAIDRTTMERHEVFRAGQDPDGLVPREITAQSGAAFFVVANGGDSGVMSWDPVAGTRPLLRWYGDFTRGASNFATDGQHMVWTQGEGKQPGGWYHEYASYSIMTAPFTTDPERLKTTARRLRSDPNGQLVGLTETFVVGCGYGAHFLNRDQSLIIVRLSDGHSWRLPNESNLIWDKALGITCDEVFALATSSSATAPLTIARVRIDSLGAPIPPD